jgi:hypothetical protein
MDHLVETVKPSDFEEAEELEPQKIAMTITK